ncbi:uncharacterized protein LOC117123120 [Anneissia japonica]|uniref:uncharacterized protein LOC117123120 n=1 Tax=Anneissia japonica TaxID=1529436 RepID=UPI00142598FB|nr:uncharacterized protein LOC117123120 [Anneissia japonica]
MTSYVSEKLEEWNLQSLKEIFEENLIDEEAFLLLDVDTIKELIKPVGPRLKFIANLKKLKEDMLPVVVPSHNEPCMQSLNDSLSSDSSEEFIATTSQCSSQSSEEFTEPPRKKIKSVSNFIPHVRALLESSVVGESLIKEIEEGELTRKSRLKFVRLVVAKIIEQFGDIPKCEVKTMMAKAIVEEFPSLKDEEGQGFVSLCLHSIKQFVC